MSFVVFEGLDQSGKSTLIKALSPELEKRKLDFVVTREPGGTILGEKIRDIILNPYGEALSPQTEVLLLSAGRKDHIEKVILPAIESGQWVICDRFWASTTAFQCKGRGLPEEQVKWINQFTVSDVQPDLWILLDLPLVEKEKRGQVAGKFVDRFEIQDRSFHQRVRESYLDMARANKDSWLVLNALLTTEQLVLSILEEFKKRKWLNS